MQNVFWKDEVYESLVSLGGKNVSLQEIYDEVKRRNKIDFKENHNWQAKIRQTLEFYSSDSDCFFE